jgi:prevent-host-death family protein
MRSLSLVEDVKTISELKKNLRAICQQIHRTGRPIVITVKGRPSMVLMDVHTFERKIAALNLATLLADGEEDIRRGRTKPARTFLKDLRRARKISS